MRDATLRLHRYEPASRVNGPGLRAVVWAQGCAFNCPGCFNPETHAMQAGEIVPVENLAEKILSAKDNLEGLTLSGGEPIYQHRAFARLLSRVKAESNLSVLVFSGYTWEEIQKLRGIESFLRHVDVLLAGRFDASLRVANGLIGSANKTVHFLTGRYHMADLESVPQAEVILNADGEIILSGIDPLNW
jgi:anaerobic ribonucleoside-triphosphate reductase activating protein